MSDINYITDKKNSIQDWYDENSIPKAPVPSLEHTLKRYLEYVSVIVNNDQAKLSHTEKAIAEFRSVGKRLHEKLEKIADEQDNWINQFWLPEMYLKVRLPLPTNSNPAYIFPQQKFNNLDEQLSYTAWIVRGFCDYKDLIDRRLISREISTGRQKVNMCMEQYDRMFRCYREPNSPIDILHYKPAADETINCNEHILVMCNNQTFVVFTRFDGVKLSQAEIAKQLGKVVKMSQMDGSAKNSNIIGGGSVGDRDDAAKFWNLMKQDKQNQESFNWILSASFAVCIDINGETKWSKNYEDNLAHRGLYLLHGFGSNAMGLNRWYDMTIQIIVSNDGTNGLCIEHSVAEGIVLINMVEYAMQFVKRNNNEAKMHDNLKNIAPLQLHWTILPNAKPLLQKQIDIFNDLANDLNLQVLIFDGFGKEFIKSCQISPDGFVQLTMQLAYYRLHGHLVSTYESASIRRFRYGRVDNIRAATPEALLWVQAMLEKNKTQAEKQKLFVEAVKKQAEITLENVTGYGIDNHLCALQSLAREEVQKGLLPKMPDLFLDPAWIETMRFPLSTSQVTTIPTINDTYLCYGPVAKDGYGCSYNIQPNSIIFAPSSFDSCPKTNAENFKKSLVDSLNDIQALIKQ
ncbi:Choline O-acetyltransferase [Dirofilaria immitis]